MIRNLFHYFNTFLCSGEDGPCKTLSILLEQIASGAKNVLNEQNQRGTSSHISTIQTQLPMTKDDLTTVSDVAPSVTNPHAYRCITTYYIDAFFTYMSTSRIPQEYVFVLQVLVEKIHGLGMGGWLESW